MIKSVLISTLWAAMQIASPAKALEVGQAAPDFELPSTKGGVLKLSSFKGKKSVLIEFYVLEFTPT
jgi:thioredoxin-dependent peroxiredoxin